MSETDQLIARQYEDRPHLRPVLDAVLALVPSLGSVTVQARGTLVSLVSPRRTFASLKPTTKSRVDLGLRLDGLSPEGRLRAARDIGPATLRIPLTEPADVDDEVLGWLRRAYEENSAPPPPRPPARRPKPVTGTLAVAIEGSELPGLTCHPEPDGTVHRNIHVALAITAKAAGQRGTADSALIIPGNPRLAAEPVPGDSKTARWDVSVTVRGSAGDGYDFTGPAVRGDRTDRHLGLVWGDVPGDGTFRLFRGAKLRLVDVPSELITRALRPGHRLVARVRLTDGKGNPVCARLGPDYLTWSVTPGSAGRTG